MANEAHKIRALNDDLRRHLSRSSEMAVMTPGIAALGQDAVDRIVQTIATYDDFCHANDPHAHYLGHRNLQSTARYTALAPDRFAKFWHD